MTLEQLDNFDPDQFLSEYWQKKPVLIRGFIADFEDPVEADSLAGLACEAELESRLVTNPGPDQYQLEHGPFPESRFDGIGAADWTLLVQAVDQWVPEVAALRRNFHFLPSWRLEDIMVSFAAPGGSVGPHFDQYDVFLLQGSGSRQWQLGPDCDANTPCRNADGLSLLTDFTAEHSVELRAGDVLYLPPRVSHWGRALEAGLCFSIGLRSPSMAEMLEGFSNNLIAAADPGQRYQDPQPTLPRQAGEIEPDKLEDVFNKLLQLVDNKGEFDLYFGCQVTQPRYPEQIHPPARPISDQELDPMLDKCTALLRHPGSRFAFMGPDTGPGLVCFADGEAYPLPAEEAALIAYLCDLTIENIKDITAHCRTESGRRLLLQLLNLGSLVLD